MLAQAATTIWKIIAVTIFMVNGQPMEERSPHPDTFKTQAECVAFSKTEKFQEQWANFKDLEQDEHGADAKVTWSCQEGRLLPEGHPGADA